MVWAIFITSMFIYIAHSWLSYGSLLKETRWAFWIALSLTVVVNSLWLILAKKTLSPEKLLFFAMCWDAIVLVASIGVPLVIYNVRPSVLSTCGLLLFVVGLLVFKLGSIGH